jgi:ribonuclease P protein component
MDETFGPRHRLTRRVEFTHVYEHGLRAHGRLMSVYAAPNERATARLGVTATRKFGRAVARNAAKRRLREVFRRRKAASAGLDLVVMPRPGFLESPFQQVAAEYDALVDHLLRRMRAVRP